MTRTFGFLFLLCSLLGGTPAMAATSGNLVSRDNKCLDVKDGKFSNGNPVQLWDCSGYNTNQQWSLSNGQLKVGNKCLDVVDGRFVNGGSVQLWDCFAGSTNQAWELAGNNLRKTGTNFCLDVKEGNYANGASVQIYACDWRGVSNQVWSFGAAASSGQPSGGNNPYGYLQTSGTRIVDSRGNGILLRGTNIGGWLVTEGWMNGYTDTSDKDPYRFSLETLERRFGRQTANDLINVWRDNFFTASDLDNIKSIGLNVIRVPFGFRNLQDADGNWIKNNQGNIDFSRLDWIVSEAAKRGIYTILDFHIWRGQQANYDTISQNTDAGHDQQAQAAAIWVQVASHFKGNASIAGYDAINEPTGSYANMMQDALYKAIRSVDADRIIFMESMGADPASLKWRQVSYSIHQYGMMGNDFGSNQQAFYKDINGSIASFRSFNIPTYIGEFMVQENGPTLAWLLSQYNSNQLHWTNWTYKTVNMGAWGLCNLSGNAHVDLLNDSSDTIRNRWRNLGGCTPEAAVVSAFKQALR